MTEGDQSRNAERLPEEPARRLLARASELEAARNSELSVAELREAAREAGIAPSAFEQALAELRDSDPAAVSAPALTRLSRLVRFWPAAVILAVLLSYVLGRLVLGPT
jgi:hypothetical protein